MILRVSSEVASEKAVRILHSVARHSATPRLLQEIMQVGVASRLCLVLQVDCKAKTREKAKEILTRILDEACDSPLKQDGEALGSEQ
ncbi:hypothetical protein C4D60_Mb07t25300 [Musa balbisiana]|uniref:U-box domain-containing protein n=1 Tax=Musa balbisiana TaxID=52838 RepID=A0A4S8JJV2_MUSBA|nr:hypothetical protein C4D60_Mb07t25300 [Musa balbisiana]